MQAVSPDELPERLIGAVRIAHAELSSAVVADLGDDPLEEWLLHLMSSCRSFIRENKFLCSFSSYWQAWDTRSKQRFLRFHHQFWSYREGSSRNSPSEAVSSPQGVRLIFTSSYIARFCMHSYAASPSASLPGRVGYITKSSIPHFIYIVQCEVDMSHNFVSFAFLDMNCFFPILINQIRS